MIHTQYDHIKWLYYKVKTVKCSCVYVCHILQAEPVYIIRIFL